ncbi:flavodoxin family protein [Hydrogenimonas sp.]
MQKIFVVNGSYRENGIIDQTVDVMIQTLYAAGVETETLWLRRFPVDFCLNCRSCTQQPGPMPGACVLSDGMHEVIEKLEEADGYIFASPTNFGSATALYKRFLERLIPYAYWPWGERAPIYRKAGGRRKSALLVASSAAPEIIGRLFYSTLKQLKMGAKVVGADTVGTLFTGAIAPQRDPLLPQRTRVKAEKLAKKLIVS